MKASPPAALALVATLLAVALHAMAPPAAFGSGSEAIKIRTTLPAVESQAMCVTCKIPLPIADSLQATRERAFIQRLIDRGLTETQIERELVHEYGPAVLSLPSSHGFGLAAYLVPPSCYSRCSPSSPCSCPAGVAGRAPRSPSGTPSGTHPHSAPPTRPGWTPTSRVSTDGPLRHRGGRHTAIPPASPRESPYRYISRGAPTPSRSSRQRAIVPLAATHSAMRWDSTAGCSAPTTRQSR